VIDWGETLKALGAIAGSIIGGTGVWAYVIARQKAKIEAPAAIATSQADLVAAMTLQTKMLFAESRTYRLGLSRKVAKQDERIDRIMQEVSECNERHAECETKLAHHRAEIAQMLRDANVATYPNGGANASD
jgi:F420-0:gamma-glutamyl ligase-like protein